MMAAPANDYAFSYDQMTVAAENWRKRAGIRENQQEMLKDKRYDGRIGWRRAPTGF
jgi:hypothetical protein